MSKIDVHTEHCCIIHGCKYGKDDCTVETKKFTQSFPCEICETNKEEPMLQDIIRLRDELINKRKCFYHYNEYNKGLDSAWDDMIEDLNDILKKYYYEPK